MYYSNEAGKILVFKKSKKIIEIVVNTIDYYFVLGFLKKKIVISLNKKYSHIKVKF